MIIVHEVKKFAFFYATRRLITVFIRAPSIPRLSIHFLTFRFLMVTVVGSLLNPKARSPTVGSLRMLIDHIWRYLEAVFTIPILRPCHTIPDLVRDPFNMAS
jgi:hypothetical protein